MTWWGVALVLAVLPSCLLVAVLALPRRAATRELRAVGFHALSRGESSSVPVSRPASDVVIAFVGEVDAARVPELREQITSALETGARQVVIDLGETTLLDSLGVSLLLSAHRRSREAGGHLTVANPGGQVRRTLELSGLDRVLDVVTDRSSPALA